MGGQELRARDHDVRVAFGPVRIGDRHELRIHDVFLHQTRMTSKANEPEQLRWQFQEHACHKKNFWNSIKTYYKQVPLLTSFL